MPEETIKPAPSGKAGTSWTGGAPLIVPEPWMQDALCTQVDPDLFFPAKGDQQSAIDAKKVCAECPVRVACREYAVRTVQTYGIWGGESQAQLVERRAAA